MIPKRQITRLSICKHDVVYRLFIPEHQDALAQLFKYRHQQSNEWQANLKAALESAKKLTIALDASQFRTHTVVSDLIATVFDVCFSYTGEKT